MAAQFLLMAWQLVLSKPSRYTTGYMGMTSQVSHQLDDLLNHVGGHWAHIGAVGCARIRHDCGLKHTQASEAFPCVGHSDHQIQICDRISSVLAWIVCRLTVMGQCLAQ